MIAPFPLAWPPNLKRTPAKEREKGAFKATLSAALANVRTALTRFGHDSGIAVDEISLSSNVSLGENTPSDAGVAVWFRWGGEQHSIAVDRYTKPEANLQAIFHIIEARRTELRHGTLQMVQATFSGLRALAPPTPGQHWTDILELPADVTVAAIEASFKHLARNRHPDARGGSSDAMAQLNAARQAALQERG